MLGYIEFSCMAAFDDRLRKPITCWGSSHGQPAGLCGSDVDTICQRGNDQPGTIPKILISACAPGFSTDAQPKTHITECPVKRQHNPAGQHSSMTQSIPRLPLANACCGTLPRTTGT